MKENPYKRVSKKYRDSGKGQLSVDEVDAYLEARMPATRAAIELVLKEVASRIQGEVKSFLDVGAGPGTGYEAALEVFPIERAVLVEGNAAMAARGAERFSGSVSWLIDWAESVEFPKADLALFGYSFGEIADLEVLKRVWAKVDHLVVVEPGTPRGFEGVLRVREALIDLGGHMVAPCPHMEKCPMEGGSHWCHFSVRLERSREHMRLKGATLGYEDEKFSYVAFSKRVASACSSRVVHVPKKEKGSVVLQLCEKGGLTERRITKRQGAHYKEARKIKWGDFFEVL